jgi:hypothetical protein
VTVQQAGTDDTLIIVAVAVGAFVLLPRLGAGQSGPQFRPPPQTTMQSGSGGPKLSSTIGGLAGAGLGAYFGGPVGISVGASIGSTVGPVVESVGKAIGGFFGSLF